MRSTKATTGHSSRSFASHRAFATFRGAGISRIGTSRGSSTLHAPDLPIPAMMPPINVTLTVALMAPVAAIFAQDAPMFRGDLAHTGVYQSAASRTLDVVKWKFSTGAYMIS